MSDLTNLHVQRELKPKIEDVTPHFLDGAAARNALDFVAFLRANKMSPAWAGVHNQWKSASKGKNICRISFDPWPPERNAKWTVTAYLQHANQYEDVIIAEGLQPLLWDNVFYCVQKPKDSPPAEVLRQYALSPPCNLWGCAPGKDVTICGKQLTNVCCNTNRQYYWVYDPDEAALEGIKRLLQLERQARLS